MMMQAFRILHHEIKQDGDSPYQLIFVARGQKPWSGTVERQTALGRTPLGGRRQELGFRSGLGKDDLWGFGR
jgi:hypothetical protein